MIWVYGICDRPDAPAPEGSGLAEAPLEGLREGEVLAVFSRHVQPPGDPALDALWVHERVIERLMTDRAVLPMRFGTRLAGDDALHAILASRQQEFLAALDRVRGRVELGVRAMRRSDAEDGHRPATPPAMTGRAYIEGKLRDGRRAAREVAPIHEPLAGIATASARHAHRPEELLRASYLVDSAAVVRFRSTVDQLQRADADLAILCTGPWPPYSFVSETVPR
jgi:hypothetical protein